MKPIKDIKEIEIKMLETAMGNIFYWRLTDNDFGIRRTSENEYTTRGQAISNFKHFAELNGITNYKIEGVTQ